MKNQQNPEKSCKNLAQEIVWQTCHNYSNTDQFNLINMVAIDCQKTKLVMPFINKLDKVKLIRTKKREGLIRARLKGAAIASGEVLVFLDSHCEAAEGWLEPLIDPIARNPNVSTVPLIEIIDDNTFQLYSTPIESVQVGGFDWNLM